MPGPSSQWLPGGDANTIFTGNYVKVVQRVPVKIVFASPPGGHWLLGPGMSVEPYVKIR